VTSARRARHVVVHGRVQGVGFRFATQREARRLGLVGWVSNRADGAVEVHFEGAALLVAELEEWLTRGPVTARVERIEACDAPCEDAAVFEVRR
jgi:acylphosphatase